MKKTLLTLMMVCAMIVVATVDAEAQQQVITQDAVYQDYYNYSNRLSAYAAKNRVNEFLTLYEEYAQWSESLAKVEGGDDMLLAAKIQYSASYQDKYELIIDFYWDNNAARDEEGAPFFAVEDYWLNVNDALIENNYENFMLVHAAFIHNMSKFDNYQDDEVKACYKEMYEELVASSEEKVDRFARFMSRYDDEILGKDNTYMYNKTRAYMDRFVVAAKADDYAAFKTIADEFVAFVTDASSSERSVVESTMDNWDLKYPWLKELIDPMIGRYVDEVAE